MCALPGLSIAVLPGPNAAICIGRTLAAGRKLGLGCGLGTGRSLRAPARMVVVGVFVGSAV